MRTVLVEDWRPRGVDALEPAADAAVRSTANQLVIAGPGAGKTELLAQRASFLLETALCRSPNRILAISFKRDSARNLEQRVRKRCGQVADRFDSMTLDAFGKSLVDRFRAALPTVWRPGAGYEVMTRTPHVREMRDWFESVSIPTNLAPIQFQTWSNDRIKTGFERIAYGVPLPYDGADVQPIVRHFGLRWWQERIGQPDGTPGINFPMANRLAAYLLRLNPTLLGALRATYSYVFLDEFQDTTGAQYDLVQTAFRGSDAILTAVGDSKQRIMVWAGAMPDAFDVFKSDFLAEPQYLVRNYRSAPELVHIQHTIAQAIESNTPTSEASQVKVTNGECYIAEFATPEQEADYLAGLFSTDIKQSGLIPRDFCVLARQQPGQMTTILQNALRKHGVRLRDESDLQALLAEPVIEIVLAVLRLVIRGRDPEAWGHLNEHLERLNGWRGLDDAEVLRSESTRCLQFAKQCAAIPGRKIETLPLEVIDKIGRRKIQATYRQYASEAFLLDRLSLFGKALGTCGVADLKAAVEEMIGADIIPAMSVHKSKGLEFHTVVFLGLEDSQLWNFAKQSDEEKRGFFVALSRAITRVVFTFSDLRDGKYGRKKQERKSISDLYTLLKTAGVETRDLRK